MRLPTGRGQHREVFAEQAPADLIELHQRSTAAVAAEIRQRSR